MRMQQKPSVRIELEELRQRLQEAEETLGAIRSGGVDALVVSGPSGEKVFTLEGAEHPYRILIESMNEGAISLSSEGIILYCNSAFARMVRSPLDQIMSRDLCDFVVPDQRHALKDLINLASDNASRTEMTLLTVSEETLPTQFSLNPVHLEEGVSIGVVVTDLSEHKLHQQAEASVRMRDEFLAVASHELRTPLSTLVLRLGLLEHHAAKGDLEQVSASASRAQEQASRIGRLVDRLLDVSQLASERLKLELRRCTLDEIVRAAAERLSEQAASAGCDITLELENDLIVRADKFRLDDAFSNVIANAIKFGAGKPIEIQLKAADGDAVVCVEDHGIGIPEEDLSRIFGRFERATQSRQYSGLGLGLYIASQVVERHGGSIRAENRSKGGTRFTIELPLVENARSQARD
jgi:PAS domain S-box-containing protein